ncbi:MAG: hypothetical protein ACYC2O_05970 [Microthrixaceae bacterium]
MPKFDRENYLRKLQPHNLRGRNLRYALLTLLWQAGRPCTISELIEQLESLGLVIGGPTAPKLVGDALRWETNKGRVRRTARARYESGPRPPSTARKHRDRLRDLVNEGHRRRVRGEAA